MRRQKVVLRVMAGPRAGPVGCPPASRSSTPPVFASAPLLLASVLAAGPGEPAVVPATTGPAAAVSFATEPGRLYQVQRQGDAGWEDVGDAVRGDGAEVVKLLPAGEYRVVRPDGWAVVWRDEFDGDTLDLTKWGYEVNNLGGGNFERQAYRDDPKYCFVNDGSLHIAAYRDPHTTPDGKTQPYSSARIRTKGRFEFLYGRVEVRAKVPAGEGIWPAAWMLPTASPYGGWAAGGEIDILESRGSAVQETTGALHFGGEWPRNEYVAHAYRFPGPDAAAAFHVYMLEWGPDAISWSVDGEPARTRTAGVWFTEAAPGNPSAPFDAAFHLLLNVAVDGRFFEKTDQRADRLPPGSFPQTLLVDYVRVSQRDAR